jgi:hypothetical protein
MSQGAVHVHQCETLPTEYEIGKCGPNTRQAQDLQVSQNRQSIGDRETWKFSLVNRNWQ